MKRTVLALSLLISGLPAEENPLKPALVPDRVSVKASEPFYVALHLPHPNGWHTYWQYPGVVGIPTSVKWDFPPGWQASPIHWPPPLQVDMLKIKAQGYRGDIYLPVRITPPPKIEETSVTLRGKAVWMCCGSTCHPGFQDLSLTLPVRSAGDPSMTPDESKIVNALQSEPKPCSAWKTSASLTGDTVRLSLSPATADANSDPGAITFFTLDGMTDSDVPQVVSRAPNGGYVVELKTWDFSPKNSKTLPGVLKATNGWTKSPDAPHFIRINSTLSR